MNPHSSDQLISLVHGGAALHKVEPAGLSPLVPSLTHIPISARYPVHAGAGGLQG